MTLRDQPNHLVNSVRPHHRGQDCTGQDQWQWLPGRGPGGGGEERWAGGGHLIPTLWTLSSRGRANKFFKPPILNISFHVRKIEPICTFYLLGYYFVLINGFHIMELLKCIFSLYLVHWILHLVSISTISKNLVNIQGSLCLELSDLLPPDDVPHHPIERDCWLTGQVLYSWEESSHGSEEVPAARCEVWGIAGRRKSTWGLLTILNID